MGNIIYIVRHIVSLLFHSREINNVEPRSPLCLARPNDINSGDDETPRHLLHVRSKVFRFIQSRIYSESLLSTRASIARCVHAKTESRKSESPRSLILLHAGCEIYFIPLDSLSLSTSASFYLSLSLPLLSPSFSQEQYLMDAERPTCLQLSFEIYFCRKNRGKRN